MNKTEQREMERLKHRVDQLERSLQVANKSLHIKSRMLELVQADEDLDDDDMDGLRRRAIADCNY